MRLGSDKRVRVNILILITIIGVAWDSLDNRVPLSFLGDFLEVI
jgi:hypothetical protein